MDRRKNIWRLIGLLAVVIAFNGTIAFAAEKKSNAGSPAVGAAKITYWDNPQGDVESEDDIWEENETVPSLLTDTVVLVKGGDSKPIVIESGQAVWFLTNNAAVCTVSEDGMVAPVGEGETTVLVEALGTDGRYYSLECRISVIDPRLSADKIDLLLNREATAQVTILGLSEYVTANDITYTVDKPEVAEVQGLSIYDGRISLMGKQAGKALLTVTICGKTLSCEICVKYYHLNKNTLVMKKGTKKTLKVSGIKEKAEWSVTNQNIGTITSKGIFTAKKNGNTTVKVKVGGFTLKCYISVADPRAIAAVKKAKSVIGAVYSQEKRMQKGYYDCSSLVWRSYQPYGITLGNPNWAPTAADQAKWCMTNKKVVAEQGIKLQERKLRPGDLIFYSRSSNQNGRYKNIYHVAMFSGYEVAEYDKSNPELYGVIVEADGRLVSERAYADDYGEDKKIVMIARPVK